MPSGVRGLEKHGPLPAHGHAKAEPPRAESANESRQPGFKEENKQGPSWLTGSFGAYTLSPA